MRNKKWAAISVAVLAYGIVCLLQYPGMRERAVRVPRMTLEELARDGPGADGYLTLTGVRLAARGHALWQDGESPGHIQLYVPVYSASLSREPEPGGLSFVLEILDTG